MEHKSVRPGTGVAFEFGDALAVMQGRAADCQGAQASGVRQSVKLQSCGGKPAPV